MTFTIDREGSKLVKIRVSKLLTWERGCQNSGKKFMDGPNSAINLRNERKKSTNIFSPFISKIYKVQ